MNEEISLEKITALDFKEVSELAHKNGGSKKFSPEHLTHQYLENPFNSFSMWKVKKGAAIEGFATTNNFQFNIMGRAVKVAMPQNVLTSESVRGKGLFNKLYHCTEEENKNEHQIENFLTFTNELSTPIFLKKFDYLKGKCPDVIFYFPLFRLPNSYSIKKIDNVEEIRFEQQLSDFYAKNSMIKNRAYYSWRYKNYSKSQIKIIEVELNQKLIGTAIMKVEWKKGIKFLLLLDIICPSEDLIPAIIQSCRAFALKHFYMGVLVFKLRDIDFPTTLFKKTFENRFNFLVKGGSKDESEVLSNLNFNFFLGDLDIF